MSENVNFSTLKSNANLNSIESTQENFNCSNLGEFSIFDSNGDGFLSESELSCIKDSNMFDEKTTNLIVQHFMQGISADSLMSEYSGLSTIVDNYSSDKTKEEAQDEIPQEEIQDEYHSLEEQNLQNKPSCPDGVIDDFIQSTSVGDCWLLAQTKSISETSWGQNTIQNCIKQNDKGDYLISFDGIDTEISISKDELDSAISEKKYSNGDADTTLIELAFEKYCTLNADDRYVKDKKQNSLEANAASAKLSNNILDANHLDDEISLQNFLFGNTGKKIINEETNNDKILKLLDNKAKSSDDSILTLSLKSNNGAHAYSISKVEKVDNQYVISITNPWDTSKIEQLGYEELLERMSYIHVFNKPESV